MKKSQSTSSVSIVIPVYNEESYLDKCLQAIAKQTVAPLEVIVVDNNSSDRSSQVARQYPFVRFRNKGFNAAQGVIIARIDADSIVMPAWVERLQVDFEDKHTQAVTGLGKTCTLPRLHVLHTTLWSRAYFWYVHSYFTALTMWGANMALQRTMWDKIKSDVCLEPHTVHEDQDLSLLIAGYGGKTIQDNQLLITTNGQSYHYWPKFFTYIRMTRKTRAYHRRRGTLENPKAARLSFGTTFFGRIVYYFLTIPFVVVSLLLWPIDDLVLRYAKHPGHWLD
ncbi:glycosyltransferase family 2 protein [Candidatus Saccharibacteria bacterium]|nr:glycosyltransferase family 2 protein [Candidatus Saccharibacteria bacterium]